jgi:hypothetical protein
MTTVPQDKAPALPARLDRIVVESNVPVLDTGMFDHMIRIARLMAASSLVPAHLNSVRKEGTEQVAMSADEAMANCFLVVNQGLRWRMDPFAVAQHVFIQKGRIGYEGKLVAAVINTHPGLAKRLSYEFDGPPGSGKRKVTVTGRVKGDEQDRRVEGTVEGWQTNNENWKKSPDQMLVYRGAREWARRWMPEAILGVYAEEELEFEHSENRQETEAPAPPQRGAAGLKAALKQEPEPVEPKAPEPRQRDLPPRRNPPPEPPKGSPEVLEKFVKKLGECSDAEILALVRDEANLFQWNDEDRETLDVAYSKRQDELGA